MGGSTLSNVLYTFLTFRIQTSILSTLTRPRKKISIFNIKKLTYIA